MAYFGDGGTSQGDFHEGLNFAGVFQTPAIFSWHNNQTAISIPRTKQTRSKTIAQKALAYGFLGKQETAYDILATYAAAKEAVDRARSGDGPTLIECVTYRMAVHTTADDPKRYRTDQEVEKWKKRDPITRYQRYLLNKGLLSGETIDTIESAVLDEIQAAIDNAEDQRKTMGDPMHMFEYAYAEMSPFLREQKEEFARELAEIREEGNNG